MLDTTMFTSGTFRLKGRKLLQFGHGVENAHQLSMRSRVSWPTVHKYINQPEKIAAISMEVVAGILVDGLGMSPQEVLNLRFGDLFDYVSKTGEVAE